VGFLLAGVVWLVFALVVFQFDTTSVNAISILLGVTCVGGALLELIAIPASHGWWAAARVALAVGFAAVGIVAFVDPGKSFDALATIFAFYLLLRAVFELIAAFASRGRQSSWVAHAAGRDYPDPARLLGCRELRSPGVPPGRVGRRKCTRARCRRDRSGV